MNAVFGEGKTDKKFEVKLVLCEGIVSTQSYSEIRIRKMKPFES